MKQQTGPKLEKKYIKVVDCRLAYLTYMKSISCKMLGWMKHKLESRLLGSVQFSRSVVSDSLRPHGHMPGLPVYHQLPEPTQTHVHHVSYAIQPSHPLAFHSLPSFNLSQDQGLFQWVCSSHQVSKVLKYWSTFKVLKYWNWSFSFSISHSIEYSVLISFKVDSLYLLSIQGIHKSLLQHHSSKASILQHSAFFIVQLSHPYMTRLLEEP